MVYGIFSIIRNGNRQTDYPQHFIDNTKCINNMEDVVYNL